MQNKMDKISIIVPCYNEQDALACYYAEFCKMTSQMNNVEFELLLINDGSKDSTLEEMKSLSKSDGRITYISFSRNFGKEAAIYAGLKNATGNYVSIMDADLQDPPSLLPTMYKIVKEDGFDSAATRRVSRIGEPPIRSFFARMFYRIMNKISQTDMVDGARDYRLMNRKFVDSLLEMGEYNRFSKGLFGWIGFKTKWLEYENIERVAGETSWSFWGLFKYSLEGIIAFSTAPLVLSSISGVLSCTIAFIFLLFIIIRRLCFGDPVAGWASTVSILLFIGGIQLFCTGILGQYLAKTYMEVKKRPIYIISETNKTSSKKDEI